MRDRITVERLYVWLFLVYGLLLTAIVVTKLPPFMGPDELNQIKRADLINYGQVTGKRVQIGDTVTSGGPSSINLDAAESHFRRMEFHPEVKVSPGALALAAELSWDDLTAETSFENTAEYPPFLYLPQTVAIGIGKGLGLSILPTLLLARFANALGCLAVGYAAIFIGKGARPLLFTVLLMPMAMALDSSVTQDGMLIAVAGLACAIIARSLRTGNLLSKAETWAVAICLTLVGMAKPPYILLSLLILLVSTKQHQWRAIACYGSLAADAAWHVLMAAFVNTPIRRPGVVTDQAAQISFLLHHPAAIPGIAGHTLIAVKGELVAQMIGVLGWLDTLLPKAYYVAALVVLLIAVSITWTASFRGALAALAILAMTKIGIFAALYVSYNPVGAGVIDGVQGRYFLPLLAMLPLALVGRTERNETPLRNLAGGIVLIFPLVSVLITYHALTVRYYG